MARSTKPIVPPPVVTTKQRFSVTFGLEVETRRSGDWVVDVYELSMAVIAEDGGEVASRTVATSSMSTRRSRSIPDDNDAAVRTHAAGWACEQLERIHQAIAAIDEEGGPVGRDEVFSIVRNSHGNP